MTLVCASYSSKTLHTAAAGLHTAEAQEISSRQRGKGASVPLKPRSGARSLARVCLEMPSQRHNTLRSLLVLEAAAREPVLLQIEKEKQPENGG